MRGLTPILLGGLTTVVVLAGGCGDDGSATDSTKPAGGDAASGKQIYGDYCATCHGRELQGTELGPAHLDAAFAPSVIDDAAFRRAVHDGVTQRRYTFGDMAPIPHLSDAEIADVIAYVRARQRAAGIG